jgi:hypothetical protein
MMTKQKSRAVLLFALYFLLFPVSLLTSGQTPARAKTYPLFGWSNVSCGAKGRFQDLDYCGSAVIDQIVSDGKLAIPVLISQITDARLLAKPAYNFWPKMRTGELAYLILSDLFLDDTWKKSTMPDLFPSQECHEPGWVCWEVFRKTHSLQRLQARWTEFWKANQDKVYWDGKARCYRLTEAKDKRGK